MLNTGITWHYIWIHGITANPDAGAIGGNLAIVDVSAYYLKSGFGINRCYDGAAYPCVCSLIDDNIWISSLRPGKISLEIKYMGD